MQPLDTVMVPVEEKRKVPDAKSHRSLMSLVKGPQSTLTSSDLADKPENNV